MATGDVDLRWATDVDLTLDVSTGPLASDANLLAGRESTVVVSSSQSFVEDFLLSGQFTTGTGPTADRVIEVWAYAQIRDTPVYPDVLDGTDSNETITSTGIKNAALKLVAVLPTDGTNDRAYLFGPVSVASLFGGILPERWGVFVVHNTGVAFNSTAGNHFVAAAPVYSNIAA
ncbi:MAG: hypothetical protein ACR2QC_07990 [Gammaproteobacteria bacterium]